MLTDSGHTIDAWHEFLAARDSGDLVEIDEGIFDYFLNVLPPVYMGHTVEVGGQLRLSLLRVRRRGGDHHRVLARRKPLLLPAHHSHESGELTMIAYDTTKHQPHVLTHQFADNVAAELHRLEPEAGWQYQTRLTFEGELAHWATVRDESGRAFSFGSSQYPVRDRWSVSGIYPRNAKGEQISVRKYSDGEPHEPVIYMAKTKNAESIAREIARRFLPDYEKRLAVVRDRVEADNGYLAKQQETRSRMERAGVRFYEHSPETGSTSVTDRGYACKVQVNSDTVNLDLRSVPTEVAAQILQLIRGGS